MFDSIRNHKKYLMGFLMILIIPSFVLFGIEGYTRFNERSEPVASVDGHDITKAEWDQAHQVEAQRLRESMPGLDARLLDSDEARYATLDRLVRDRVLAVAAEKDHLYTTDARLAAELQRNQAIATLRKPDGTLDVEAYRELLARQGLSPEMFEARVRADLSRQQVLGGVTASVLVTPAVAAQALEPFFQRREIRVQMLAAKDFAARVQPTEAEIEAFYNSNQALFQAPEQVDVEYLVLDAAALAKEVTLNEADLRAYYDQNAVALSGGEERRASHILLTVPAGASAEQKAAVRQKAQELLDQVRKDPAKFAELAKAHSQDPGSAAQGGDLGFFGRNAMVKPFEDAAFALAKGGISDLVESEFGFHIIELTDIRAPKVRSFAEMRAQLEGDLKKQQAQKQFSEAAETFSNLVYEQADSLQPAAERLKLTVQTAQGVTREPRPDAGVLGNQRLLAALFAPDSLEKKQNTEALETGSGQLTSARVTRHEAAHTKPLAEVREQVRAQLVAQRSAQLAGEAGAQRLEALKAGGDASGLPAAVTVSRDQPQGVSAAVLRAALSAPATTLPAWAGVDLGAQGYAIVKVEKLLPRSEAEAARRTQERQQYAQWWTTAEAQAYYETLKDRFKVRILVPEPKRP
ncbi:SurA N-terminal domain-containing protein [Hydrogenophaga electricum]|uniref:Periplasmic chaperone PpiD n=1 Tax=Hydrogenophaga electricum TaxID=1230953 RepID=A0ABQ6BZ77_9BURK|nr:SurA N-terminal domain-containing protein [Hydrogenophaga electricum]GLS12814.1 peptidylprolyl isomerase [Hydrogenophaga electricum]